MTRVWLRKHKIMLPDGNIIICRNNERKVDHMKSADGILFDDYGRNLREWCEADGNKGVKIEAPLYAHEDDGQYSKEVRIKIAIIVIIQLNKIAGEDSARILVKFEGLNVGGSIKTRTAYNMILEAEKMGKARDGI